jgi:hypothetical protein
MNSQERDEYVEKMEETKQKFYEDNTKNQIFKNKQKLECAQTVSQELDLQKMIQCTVFQIPNTNIIYYNYMVYKTYGNLENKDLLYAYVIQLVEQVLQQNEHFEFHIDMKSFSVSACQRYYPIISSIFDDNKVFTDKLSKMVIYNTPSFVDKLTRILYSSIKDILPKIEYYHHKDSDAKISQLIK